MYLGSKLVIVSDFEGRSGFKYELVEVLVRGRSEVELDVLVVEQVGGGKEREVESVEQVRYIMVM